MKNGLGNLAAADPDQLAAILKNRLKASSTGPAHRWILRADWAHAQA
jgi:hypothetical protein